jgi:putative DNA-invertase from lambdoid prophage Rac
MFLICPLSVNPVPVLWRNPELIQERIRSGIAAAKARGKRLGRQPGQRPKSDRLAPKVLALVAAGRSYRLISRELGLSKNTVLEIVKRNRAMSA